MRRATTLWIAPQPLLLASTSPTRLALLKNAGLSVETQSPDVDERAVEQAARADALGPGELAGRLAAEKALAVSRLRPGRLVLGADQVLSSDGRVFHKPADRDAAFRQLKELSGRTHALHSAGCLARDGLIVAQFQDSALLAMRALGDDDLITYLNVAGTEALTSVGCYQLEHLGIHLFDKVVGDHATILGLPLVPLLAALRRLDCLAF